VQASFRYARDETLEAWFAHQYIYIHINIHLFVYPGSHTIIYIYICIYVFMYSLLNWSRRPAFATRETRRGRTLFMHIWFFFSLIYWFLFWPRDVSQASFRYVRDATWEAWMYYFKHFINLFIHPAFFMYFMYSRIHLYNPFICFNI